jgi:hypothetical protein
MAEAGVGDAADLERGYTLYVHVMDGLGADHHGGTSVGYKYQVVFEAKDSSDDVSDDDRGSNAITWTAKTKPCTSKRHLFWDENIDLILPTDFVEKTTRGIILVSLLPATFSPGYGESDVKSYAWACQLIISDLFATLKRTGPKRSEIVLSLDPVHKTETDNSSPAGNTDNRKGPQPPVQSSSVRIRVGMLLLTPEQSMDHEAIAAADLFRQREVPVVRTIPKREEPAVQSRPSTTSPALDPGVGKEDVYEVTRKDSLLQLKLPIDKPVISKKPGFGGNNMEILLQAATEVDVILKDVDCTIQDMNESFDLFGQQGRPLSLLDVNKGERNALVELHAIESSASLAVAEGPGHVGGEALDRSGPNMVKLAEYIRKRIRDFIHALEPIISVAKKLEVEEFTVVGVVKVQQNAEFDDKRRHVADILHAIYGTVIGLKNSIRAVSDKLFERITKNESQTQGSMAASGLLVIGDCYRELLESMNSFKKAEKATLSAAKAIERNLPIPMHVDMVKSAQSIESVSENVKHRLGNVPDDAVITRDNKNLSLIKKDDFIASMSLSVEPPLAPTINTPLQEPQCTKSSKPPTPKSARASTQVNKEQLNDVEPKSDLMVGDAVEARYLSGNEWFDAKIMDISTNDDRVAYSLKYTDGDEETLVARRKIRRRGDCQIYSSSHPLPSGLEVDARCAVVVTANLLPDYANFLPGTVLSGPSGHDDVEYYEIGFDVRCLPVPLPKVILEKLQDGVVLERVRRTDILTLHGRAMSRASSPVTLTNANEGTPTRTEVIEVPNANEQAVSDLAVGDLVEARYMSGYAWYEATVTNISKDTLSGLTIYSLKFEDGDIEVGAQRRKIRRKGQQQLYGVQDILPMGLQVDASCSVVVRSKLLPEDANCLPATVISGPEKRAGNITFYQVEFSLASLGLELSGKFSSEAVDGKTLEWITRENIYTAYGDMHLLVASSSQKQQPEEFNIYPADLCKGDVVEARYMTGLEWFGAKIINVTTENHTEGAIYDIRYDDGDEETGVCRRKIRRPGDELEYPHAALLPLGLFVDARCSLAVKAGLLPEYANCLAGEVVGVDKGRGRYEISFDFQQLDLHLPSKFVDELTDGKIREWKQRDEICVLHKKCEIQLDVAAPLLPNQSVDTELKLEEVVEGRYMSGFEWFQGKVLSKENDGGTGDTIYTLRYDDGDEETGMPRRKIRRKGERQIYCSTIPLPTGLHVDAACSTVVASKLLDDAANCLPAVIISGPRRSQKNNLDSYEVEFDLIGVGVDISTGVPNISKDGKVREWVPRDRICTLFGPLKSGIASDIVKSSSPAASITCGPTAVQQLYLHIQPVLAVGEKVEARYMSGLQWFAATVVGTSVSPGVSDSEMKYILKYDDGDEESGAPRRKIRRSGEEPQFTGNSPLPVGLEVDACCGIVVAAGLLGDEANCLPGSVMSGPKEEEGEVLYQIQFDIKSVGLELPSKQGEDALVGGKVAEWVPRSRIYTSYVPKLISTDGATVPAAPMISSSNDEDCVVSLKVGDIVESRYMSGLEWFSATIKSISRDVTTGEAKYDLRYDDGDTESDAGRRKIRRKGETQIFAPGALLPHGLEVDARCDLVSRAGLLPEYANCLPGRITGTRGDKYEVEFDLSTLELELPPKFASDVNSGKIRQLVGRDDMFTLWGPAAVVEESQTSQAKFDILEQVSASATSLVCYNGGPHVTEFKIGDFVEARYMSGYEWFEADIKSVSIDGNNGSTSYQLLYKDGDGESGVVRRKIRRKGENQIYSSTDILPIGLEVDAFCAAVVASKLLPTSANCLPGRIVNTPGNDGKYEVEFNLEAAGLDLPVSFSQKVIREHVVRGKIFTIHGSSAELLLSGGSNDSTVHGGQEISLSAAVTRLTDCVIPVQFLQIGETVEARYMSGTEWFGAKIAAIKDNDTYDVHYDDGDVEIDVNRRKIRRKGESQAYDENYPLPIGLEVDACCSTVTKYDLLPDNANCLPGHILSAPQEAGNHGIKYLVGFSLSRLGLKPLPEGAIEVVNDGDVKEWVGRDQIFTVHGPPLLLTKPVMSVFTGDPGVESIEPVITQPADTTEAGLRVGDKVEARYMSGMDWFGALITDITVDSVADVTTYSLEYDDGDIEVGALRRKTRRRGECQIYSLGAVLPLGLHVDACCTTVVKAALLPDYANCLPGEIVAGPKAEADGDVSYEVKFDLNSLDLQVANLTSSGIVKEWIRRENILSLHGPCEKIVTTMQHSPHGKQQKTEARLCGSASSSEPVDGTQNVAIPAVDDLTAQLALKPGKGCTIFADDLSTGARVEARYMTGYEWFPATITGTTICGDGSSTKYSLRYDDGDVEDGVLRNKLRRVGEEQLYGPGVVLPQGLEVDASCAVVVRAGLLSNNANCLPGVIKSVLDENGQEYDVEFNMEALGLDLPATHAGALLDGKIIERLSRDQIFTCCGLPRIPPDSDTKNPKLGESDSAKHAFLPLQCKEGESVEARYMSGLEWFPARIMGTAIDPITGETKYKLQYEDGDEESDAHRRKIRRPAEKQVYGLDAPLTVGVAVDACCSIVVQAKLLPEYANCLPGEIVKVISLSAYEVEFDLQQVGLQLPRQFAKRAIDGKIREIVDRDKIFTLYG